MAAEDEFGLIDHDRVRQVVRELRYDARGHGRSGSTVDLSGYGWDELAVDQFALADALGIDRYVAAGASMGAATALHAACRAPDRVRALLLVIPPTAWATRAAKVDQHLTIADLIERGQHAAVIAGAATQPPPDPLADEPRWTDRTPELLATTDPVRLARVFRGAATADLPPPDAIAAIDVPTLILAWTGDPGHPVDTAARLQELIPHAELAVATTRAGLEAWTGRVVAWLERCA
jgi:pimeloyl-ACP methyl ester carboxylesterase